MDINTLYQEARIMSEQCNIPLGKISSVTVNPRLTSTWGRCKRNRYDNSFSIEIAERLIDFGSVDGVLNTLLHEMLHTCKNCFNHKGVWKSYAERLYVKYGIDVKRCNTEKEKGMDTSNPKEKGYKFVVSCPECGFERFYRKGTKVVKNITHYQCTLCHCKLNLKEL